MQRMVLLLDLVRRKIALRDITLPLREHIDGQRERLLLSDCWVMHLAVRNHATGVAEVRQLPTPGSVGRLQVGHDELVLGLCALVVQCCPQC
jgi:hypothetical protein